MKLYLILLTLISLNAKADEKQISLKLEQQDRVETLAIKIVTTQRNEGQEIGKSLPIIYKHIISKGAKILGAPYTRYFKYSQEEVIIEVGFPTNGLIEGTGDIYKSYLPETMALTSIHIGPYSEVSHHYEKINKWLKENNKKANGPSWELSLNDPRTTTPDKYETKIIFPIK